MGSDPQGPGEGFGETKPPCSYHSGPQGDRSEASPSDPGKCPGRGGTPFRSVRSERSEWRQMSPGLRTSPRPEPAPEPPAASTRAPRLESSLPGPPGATLRSGTRERRYPPWIKKLKKKPVGVKEGGGVCLRACWTPERTREPARGRRLPAGPWTGGRRAQGAGAAQTPSRVLLRHPVLRGPPGLRTVSSSPRRRRGAEDRRSGSPGCARLRWGRCGTTGPLCSSAWPPCSPKRSSIPQYGYLVNCPMGASRLLLVMMELPSFSSTHGHPTEDDISHLLFHVSETIMQLSSCQCDSRSN
ncbi:uncharacterized protein LOC110595638 [Carlito syrichta]|uniref:Uncharacterized protein LOC110595638 n=1 Tax=Carlito syrichta TaxID=1868482 RepID=A0A3Q0DUU3_CARSF|nr:uncharacterized protein LOC110595638 [Carlito syrichta]